MRHPAALIVGVIFLDREWCGGSLFIVNAAQHDAQALGACRSATRGRRGSAAALRSWRRSHRLLRGYAGPARRVDRQRHRRISQRSSACRWRRPPLPATGQRLDSGRRSPWVGHVDVSVFVAARRRRSDGQLARRPARADTARRPRSTVETAAQAYAEFQRLYTCRAEVPRSAVPASFRLVLEPVTAAEREALVTRVRGLPAVSSVAATRRAPVCA